MADDPKVASEVSLMDLLAAGGVKYFEERALAPIVGNGTLVSGAVKLGLMFGVKHFKPPAWQPVTLALAVDGTEDVINGLFSLVSGKLSLGGPGQEASPAIVI